MFNENLPSMSNFNESLFYNPYMKIKFSIILNNNHE